MSHEPETQQPEADPLNAEVNDLLARYTAAQDNEEEPEPDDLDGGMLDEPERPRQFSAIGGAAESKGWRSFLNGTGTTLASAKPEMDLPIWGAGSGKNHANARLRVQRETAEGLWEELGYLPADAGQYTLIGKFRAAGHYRIMPIDEFGQPLHTTGFIQNIPHDHPYLRQIHSGGGVTAGNGGVVQAVGGGPLPDILSFVKETNGNMAEAFAKLDNDRSRVNQEAIAIVKTGAEETIKLNRDVLAVAAEAETKRAEHAQKLAEAALAAEREAARRAQESEKEIAKRHQELTEQSAAAHAKLLETASKQNESFMASFLTLQSTSAERERLAMEARMAEDSRRRDEWMRQQADIMERERQRLQAEAAERRDRDERERTERREAAEREAKRQEAHAQQMLMLQMKVMEASNPLANLVALAPMAAPILGALGLDGKGVIDMVKDAMAGGASKGVVSEIAETVRTAIETFGKVAQAQAGVVEEDVEEEDLGDATVRPPQIPMVQQHPNIPPQAPPGIPVEVQAAAHPNIPPQVQQQQAPVPQPHQQAPVPAAPVVNLSPTVQKKARMAIMSLVEDLASEPDQSKWEMLTMGALGPAAKEVGQYLQALGGGDIDAGILKAALEADASLELAQDFVRATKSMTLIQAALRG